MLSVRRVIVGGFDLVLCGRVFALPSRQNLFTTQLSPISLTNPRFYADISKMSPSSSAHRNLKFRRRPGKRHAWTEIERIEGEDRFYLKEPDTLRHGWAYGGNFAAQTLFCAQKTVPKGSKLSSFHSYFCSPGLGEPLEFQVKRLKDSKNSSYRRVEVTQDSKVVYHAEFLFKNEDQNKSKNEYKMIKESEVPQVPGPENLRTGFELFKELQKQGVSAEFIHGVAFNDDFPMVEHRPCNGVEFLMGPNSPSLTQNLWLRYKIENFENETNFADLITIFLSDMGLCFAGTMPFPRRAFKIIASVDLCVWIHANENVQPNDHFLYETRCMVNSKNKALNLGKLWTKDGQLIATVLQDALIELKPEKNTSKI